MSTRIKNLLSLVHELPPEINSRRYLVIGAPPTMPWRQPWPSLHIARLISTQYYNLVLLKTILSLLHHSLDLQARKKIKLCHLRHAFTMTVNLSGV